MKLKTVKRSELIWYILFGLVLAAAGLRIFYTITGDYFTFVDEYQTFDTAAGFTHTGRFQFWDFHNRTLTEDTYTRAWPHTVLLMLWFRIFGITVPAARVLSGVFGFLLIASVFYVTRKLYDSVWVSGLSCLLLLANSSVIIAFRQIRMYSLWLLLMIWFFYFVYMALTHENTFAKENRLTCLIRMHFDFSLRYVAAAFVVLFFSFWVHVNTLIAGAGFLLYSLYRLVVKKEKKFLTMIGLVAVVCLVFTALFLMVAGGVEIPVLSYVYRESIRGKLGLLPEPNIRYWDWMQEFAGSRKFFWLCAVCIGAALWKNRKSKEVSFDFSVYAFLIVVSTLFCFLYVLSRYFSDRYMLYVAPLLAILMAWGLTEAAGWLRWKPLMWAPVFLCVFVTGRSVVREFDTVYYDPKMPHHREVYETLYEDASMRPIPFAGFEFRDYYAVQITEDYVTAPFDREWDMKILKELAAEYPDGYVVGETGKIYGFPDVTRLFLQKYSEKLTGEGLDNSNIESARYHFRNPAGEMLEMISDDVRQNGPFTYSFRAEDGKTRIRVQADTSGWDKDTEIVFLVFGIFTTDKETENRCWQLLLPEGGGQGICSYELELDVECLDVQCKDGFMLYYSDGGCEEKNTF